MRKFGLILILAILPFALAAQTYNIDSIEEAFETFAEETAEALPMMGGMGLNWNDAYTGGFPRFGVGVTGGAVIIPIAAFEDVYELTGDDSLEDLSSIGIPMPMYTVDGRIGIPVLPMDVGIKVGIINSSMVELSGVSLGYTMFGGDVRWAILEGNALLPKLSVGLGYTYLKGEVVVPVPDQTVDVSSTGAGNDLVIDDSDMLFDWNVNMVDLKVQASKKLLILNLSAGLGYSYGTTSAGGGITNGTVSLDGTTLTDADIQTIEDATGVSVGNKGILIDAKNNAGSLRVFGGVGLNIPIVKIDLGLNYAIPAQTMGISGNARIQF